MAGSRADCWLGAQFGLLTKTTLHYLSSDSWVSRGTIYLKSNVLRGSSRSHKAYYDLALEVPECQLCCILSAKQVIKPSPNSRVGELDSTFLRDEQHALIGREGIDNNYFWKRSIIPSNKARLLQTSL